MSEWQSVLQDFIAAHPTLLAMMQMRSRADGDNQVPAWLTRLVGASIPFIIGGLSAFFSATLAFQHAQDNLDKEASLQAAKIQAMTQEFYQFKRDNDERQASIDKKIGIVVTQHALIICQLNKQKHCFENFNGGG